MISKNVIIPFDGNHADIPTGWSRVTALDSKYPKGWDDSTAPNNTGGATTHTHTSPSHTHTVASHTHTGNLDPCAAGGSTDASGGSNEIMACEHYHSFTTSSTSSTASGGTAVTYASVSNDPPYYTVIYIKPNNDKPIPPNGLIHRSTYDITTGINSLYVCNGSNSTPDLRNKYLKGATTGGNAGSTGGSYTNVHDITHTHTANTHTHTATSGAPLSYCARRSGGTTLLGITQQAPHYHTFTIDGATQNMNSYSGSLTTTETVEPAYHKLITYKNMDTSNKNARIGDIAYWLGDTATIPSNWALCDGTNDTPNLKGKYVKNINTTGEANNTGGSNTHTHAAQSHSHTGSGSHYHTSVSGSGLAHVSGENPAGGGSIYDLLSDSHGLDGNTSATTANYNSSTTTANSSSNEPEYVTVAYIMLKSYISNSPAVFFGGGLSVA